MTLTVLTVKDAKPLPPLPSNSTVSHQAQSPSLEGGNIQPLDLEIIEPLSYHASPVPATLEVTKTQSQGGDLSSKRYHTPQNSTPGTYSTSLTNVTLPLNSAAAVDLPLRTNECEATQPHNQATRSLGDNGPVETFPPLPLHSPQWTDRNAETQHTERRLREPSVSSMSTGILSPTFSPMAQSVASLTSSQDTNNATGHYNPGAYGTVEPVTGSPYRSQAQDAYRPGAYGAVELESNLPRQLNLAIRPKTIAWNDYQPGAYGAVELQSNPQSQLRLPVPLRDENTPQTRNLAAATEILTHPPSPPATKIPEVGGGTISRGLPESNVLSSSTSGKAPASQSLPTDASGLIRPGSSEDRRKRRARLQLISGDP